MEEKKEILPEVDLVIPKGVAAIMDYTYEGAEELRSVVLSNTVREIGDYAFRNCTGLREITIPASLVRIGEGVFDGCTNLRKILVEEDNPRYAEMNGALYNKTMGRLIRVPEGYHGEFFLMEPTQEVDPNAFRGCNCINAIMCREQLLPLLERVLPDPEDPDDPQGIFLFDDFGMMFDVDKINMGPTLDLICGAYTVPDGVEVIRCIRYIYEDQDLVDFTDIFIPDSVTDIEENAFMRCPNLKIHASAGSYAIAYAKEQGIPYEET